MFGTKCPSITSRWIQSAPAASTLRISSPSLEKSEASTDGAMTRGRGANGWDMALPERVGGADECRVTRRPPAGNAGAGFSCGRKFMPEAAIVAGDCCCENPLFYWVFPLARRLLAFPARGYVPLPA